jgi:hypothetical protein
MYVITYVFVALLAWRGAILALIIILSIRISSRLSPSEKMKLGYECIDMRLNAGYSARVVKSKRK